MVHTRIKHPPDAFVGSRFITSMADSLQHQGHIHTHACPTPKACSPVRSIRGNRYLDASRAVACTAKGTSAHDPLRRALIASSAAVTLAGAKPSGAWRLALSLYGNIYVHATTSRPHVCAAQVAQILVKAVLLFEQRNVNALATILVARMVTCQGLSQAVQRQQH